jgi:hypothetical protein
MLSTSDHIVIRRAYPDDTAALARLGQLDATKLPADSYLVAKRAERRLRSLLPTGKGIRHAPAHR